VHVTTRVQEFGQQAPGKRPLSACHDSSTGMLVDQSVEAPSHLVMHQHPDGLVIEEAAMPIAASGITVPCMPAMTAWKVIMHSILFFQNCSNRTFKNY